MSELKNGAVDPFTRMIAERAAKRQQSGRQEVEPLPASPPQNGGGKKNNESKTASRIAVLFAQAKAYYQTHKYFRYGVNCGVFVLIAGTVVSRAFSTYSGITNVEAFTTKEQKLKIIQETRAANEHLIAEQAKADANTLPGLPHTPVGFKKCFKPTLGTAYLVHSLDRTITSEGNRVVYGNGAVIVVGDSDANPGPNGDLVVQVKKINNEKGGILQTYNAIMSKKDVLSMQEISMDEYKAAGVTTTFEKVKDYIHTTFMDTKAKPTSFAPSDAATRPVAFAAPAGVIGGASSTLHA